MPDLLLILCLPLACWRLSVMLVEEVGPGKIFERLRHATERNVIGDLLACVWCTSVWVSAFLLAIVPFAPGRYVVYWLALSALAVLIDVVVKCLRP